MKLRIFTTDKQASRAAATFIAETAHTAVRDRGVFTLALSGGDTPAAMLDALALEDVPWDRTHIFQTDERVAPRGHTDRNLARLEAILFSAVGLPAQNIHPMPVDERDLDAAAVAYAATLASIAGSPVVLDLVHLGLGADGHTGSLVPEDPVLDVRHADVALTGLYRGRRRMTLTLPLLARTRSLLWLVTGAVKSDALGRTVVGDPIVPAGRVERRRAIVFADDDAARLLDLPRPHSPFLPAPPAP